MNRPCAIFFLFTAFAITTASRAAVYNNVFHKQSFDRKQLSNLSPQQIFQLTGHRMTLKEKIAFGLMKRLMKRSFRSKNYLKASALVSSFDKRDILGAILTVVGVIVLLVYLLFLIFHKE